MENFLGKFQKLELIQYTRDIRGNAKTVRELPKVAAVSFFSDKFFQTLQKQVIYTVFKLFQNTHQNMKILYFYYIPHLAISQRILDS